MPITHHEIEVTPNPLPVVGPVTDAELRATPVPISGTVSVDNFPGSSSPTAVVTRVSLNPTTATTLLASNAARKKAVIHNESGTLFLKLGTAASSTDYTYRLVANTTIEIDLYSGAITAIKASGTTDAQVTEY